MPTRQELRDLALLRLEEAEALFSAGKYNGCVYLCGYVLEMALKAAICATLKLDSYPETHRAFKVHDFDTLVLLSGLRPEVELLAGDRLTTWSLATDWETSLRYAPRDSYNRSLAEERLDALKNTTNGVLTWLQAKW